MTRLVCSAVILVCVLLCFLAETGCGISEVPPVRNLSEYRDDENFVYPGLSHKTAAGVVHGMKQVEIWLQTIAPSGRTPIHRHDCEEVAVALKGYGTLFISDGHDPDRPGKPQEFPIYPNATIIFPVDSVHQVLNTNEEEDLQIIITVSKPPVELFAYEDWSTPHHEAVPLALKWNILKSSSEFQQYSKEPVKAEDEL